MIGIFPFGKEVHKVEQKERTPKQVFILGVYASAVHAQWLDTNGKTVVKALAVSSQFSLLLVGLPTIMRLFIS